MGKVKRIATITYHNAINVGAVLQAYALQNYVASKNAKTDIIDYRNKHVTKMNKTFYLPHYTAASIAKSFLAIPMRFKLNRRFRKFMRRMSLTQLVQSDTDFTNLNGQYDEFIVGSDQVWNPYHGGGIESRFFLNFVDDSRKKHSYAASFGFSKIPQDLEKEYSYMLRDFNSISVREKSAVDIVHNLTGTVPMRSLDPIFLLPVEHWEKLMKRPHYQNKYLLVFLVNGVKDELIQEARDLARQRNLSVVCLSNTLRRIPGVRVVRGAGPEEFLGYVAEADAVFTDSFHGTAFSVLFNKEFRVGIVEQFGNKNNRSTELLRLLGIKGRGTLGRSMNEDWNLVNERVARARQQSEDYIDGIISR